MRVAYRVLAMLIATLVVVQAAAIAYALFAIEHKTDDGIYYTKDTSNGGIDLHRVLGEMVIPVIVIAFLIVAFFARIPGGVKWAGITFGVLVLQIVLAYAAKPVPFIGVLHAINAFALAAVAGIATRKARLAEAPPAQPATV